MILPGLKSRKLKMGVVLKLHAGRLGGGWIWVERNHACASDLSLYVPVDKLGYSAAHAERFGRTTLSSEPGHAAPQSDEDAETRPRSISCILALSLPATYVHTYVYVANHTIFWFFAT